MNKLFFILYSMLILSSCAHQNTKEVSKVLSTGDAKFNYNDKNGKYLVKVTSGINKKEKTFFYKRSLEIAEKSSDNILEQSISFSQIGKLKKKTSILRPKLSQYTVWFEGKKYFTELKINPKTKSIDVKMQSPEAKFNGEKSIKFPSTKTLSCFFSQIIECAKFNGFISKSIKNGNGKMSVYIIWDGYPFQNDTFTDFPSELFSLAELEYDGHLNSNEDRFNLQVAGQSIFYALDSKQQLKKMFWVSQGISMTDKSIIIKNENENGESGNE